jgi:hypothetical protein
MNSTIMSKIKQKKKKKEFDFYTLSACSQMQKRIQKIEILSQRKRKREEFICHMIKVLRRRVWNTKKKSRCHGPYRTACPSKKIEGKHSC